MTLRLGSFLLALDEATRARLLADAVRVDVPAGSVLYRDREASRMGVVVAGLVRVYLTSAEGRQVTVRYARDGVAWVWLSLSSPCQRCVRVLITRVRLARRTRQTDSGDCAVASTRTVRHRELDLSGATAGLTRSSTSGRSAALPTR
jgi:CRP-like cAMP-binding protein